MTRRWLFVLGLYAGLIAAGLAASSYGPTALFVPQQEENLFRMIWMIGSICAVYMVTSAVPFVPGAEIGLGLIAVFGARIAVLVYLCMICALSLSYLVGRLVPTLWLVRFFRYLRLQKAANLVLTTAHQTPKDSEDYLRSLTRNRVLLAFLKYRYLALAMALNMPGNTVLGGGGGLALFAGISRLFSPLGFFITVLIAVAPIPLTVYLMGYQP